MKKIGFVDYYISEWHANNYPVWIKEECEKKGIEYQISYVWAETDVSLFDGVSTKEWCEKFGAEQCATIEELCEKSDAIVILTPSFPEKHLPYASVVLPFGKPTYIDKTFAPDYATAKEIFSIAEKHGTKIFSTSALRFATELGECENCTQIMTTGGGRSADEYIVHQIEMIVKKLGLGAEAISAEHIGDQVFFKISYPDSRVASMVFGSRFPFTIYMNNAENTPSRMLTAKSDYFKLLMADILNFFETGNISFDTKETLEVMKIREYALKAMSNPGTVLDIPKD